MANTTTATTPPITAWSTARMEPSSPARESVGSEEEEGCRAHHRHQKPRGHGLQGRRSQQEQPGGGRSDRRDGLGWPVLPWPLGPQAISLEPLGALMRLEQLRPGAGEGRAHRPGCSERSRYLPRRRSTGAAALTKGARSGRMAPFGSNGSCGGRRAAQCLNLCWAQAQAK